MITSNAQQNGRKIGEILRDGAGFADLYRTTLTGRSGQHSDTWVGRVHYLEYGADDFAITNALGDGRRVGTARYDASVDAWSIYTDSRDDGIKWLGWASSLAVGVDVAVSGEHFALGRHDNQRASGGWITTNRATAKRHTRTQEG
jgi:hypothetical protein